MPFKCFTGTIWNCNSSFFFVVYSMCYDFNMYTSRREKRRNHIPNKKIPTQFPLFFWYDDDTTVDVILASKKFCVHIKIACVFNVLPTWFSRFCVPYGSWWLNSVLTCWGSSFVGHTVTNHKLYPKTMNCSILNSFSQVPSLRYDSYLDGVSMKKVNGSTHCIKGHPF